MTEHFNFHFSPRFFSSIKNYSKEKLVADSMAGIIVGIVAIPLVIAFGIASGVGPTEGLITAIIAGFIVSFLGGTKVQIGGPTGAFIVIIYGIIQQYGLGGLMIATIMAGILLVFMGVVKLGSVIKFIPYPIIIGFTSGIALTIFSTQMNDFFGLGIEKTPADFIHKWICYFQNFTHINWWAFGVGFVSLLIIIFAPKLSKKIPGSLIAIIIATFGVWALKTFGVWEGVTSIKTIGDLYELPSGIPTPHLPSFELAEGQTFLSLIQTLFPAAFTIAMLGAIESLLSAMVADGAIGDRHDSNTELVAQGVANICTPFFGGIPATGAIARTMTNINNGGKTPVAGIVHVFVLLLVLLFLGNLVGYIPMPCLAAVLIMVSYNMSGWRTVKMLLHNPKSDVLVLVTTFLLTVVFDLTIAIEIGLLLAILLFMKRMMETTSVSVIENEIVNNEQEEELHADDTECLHIPDGVEVYEINGPFFFGVASKFDELISQVGEKPKVRIIRMRKVAFIDSTGLHNLQNVCNMSKREDIHVILSGVNEKVHTTIRKSGFSKEIGEENICPNIYAALDRTKQFLEKGE